MASRWKKIKKKAVEEMGRLCWKRP